MSVSDDAFVCVYFEVRVYEGCGFAFCLRDKCVGPCL
jgi:hypothetical protein